MTPVSHTEPPGKTADTDWPHSHAFTSSRAAAETGTRLVMAITLVMMALEIGAGLWFNSMALLADGWHMGSHAVAIGVSALAYAAARRHASDRRYAFGTWKIEVLGGYTSALLLLAVAVVMAVGSVERLLFPQDIRYAEALGVAVLGLAVNVVCALILGRAHGHAHSHAHPDAHGHGHSHSHSEDLNLRAAYLHVIADAATSVLAILALAGGWWQGWSWLDPVMGIVGAVLVSRWALGLLRDTSSALLDRDMDHPVVDDIRQSLRQTGTGQPLELADLHVWRVGSGRYACALTALSADPALNASDIRQRLSEHPEIVHATIEVHHRPVPPH